MGSKKSKLKAGVTNWTNQGPVVRSTVRARPKLLSRFMIWTPESPPFKILESSFWTHGHPTQAFLGPKYLTSPWSSDCQFSIDHTLLKKQEIKELAEKTNFTVEGIFSEYQTKILIRDCHVVRESLIRCMSCRSDHLRSINNGPGKISKKKFELGTVDF